MNSIFRSAAVVAACFVVLFCGIIPVGGQSPVESGAKMEMLSDSFGFTEGPAADMHGNVYFTDQPNDRIMKLTVDGVISVFLSGAGRANGLCFDGNGCLLSCSDENNELWSIDTLSRCHSALVAGYDGKKLNGPNDLWVRPDGGIYFTDPLYPRDYWTRDPKMQQQGQNVYFFDPKTGKLIAAATDLEQPNGLAGSPDGKMLYVADIRAGKTYVYDIEPDGKLTGKRLFASAGSDGMTVDSDGNVYLTGRGITVFNSKGKQIEYIPVKAEWTANVCFGGVDRKTLFITASQYLYSLRMKVSGIPPLTKTLAR